VFSDSTLPLILTDWILTAKRTILIIIRRGSYNSPIHSAIHSPYSYIVYMHMCVCVCVIEQCGVKTFLPPWEFLLPITSVMTHKLEFSEWLQI
jgi:hypothetical protein